MLPSAGTSSAPSCASPTPSCTSSNGYTPNKSINKQLPPIDSPVTSHSFNELSRSATYGRLSTNGPPAKAFGNTVYMMKEDHEKERTRWQQKVDEIEMRLAESELLNQDMNLIKAELNKKIVEMDKNQKPLIEQNRKLIDKNKTMQAEIKKLEQKLCYSQDDLITMKDSHERLSKENNSLKEKRPFPEKLEELDRYRNQVLEYSKCITALRQSGLEKDRRYELLVHKFKRLKKCMRKGGEMDEDQKSTVGSTCSDESSISLDTITEDLEECVDREIDSNYEALFRENEELQRALAQLKLSAAFSDENMLRDQLSFAQSTIDQQQILIHNLTERVALVENLRSTVSSQKNLIKELEGNVDRLSAELNAAREEKELIEFQLIEKEEERSQSVDKTDRSCDTEESFDEHEEPSVSNNRKLDKEDVRTLKKKLAELRNARNLKLSQKQLIDDAYAYTNAQEQFVPETCAQISDWAERESEYVDRINKLQNDVDSLKEDLQKKEETERQLSEIKHTAVDMERAKKTLNDEVNRLSKEMGKLRFILQTKEESIEKEKKNTEQLHKKVTSLISSHAAEMEFLRQSEARQSEMLDNSRKELDNLQEQVRLHENCKERIAEQLKRVSEEYAKFREEQRPSIRTELERRYEETKYKLNTALEKIHEYETILAAAKKREGDGSIVDALQTELIELKEYNEHLERQFQAQADIIEALKQRVIQNRLFSDVLSKMAEKVSSVDEQVDEFSRRCEDKETNRMVDNIKKIIKGLKKGHSKPNVQPLEISTTHAKIRAFNSSDSAGCLSNSSEGITSPDERQSDDEWDKTESRLRPKQRGNDFVTGRSSSALSS